MKNFTLAFILIILLLGKSFSQTLEKAELIRYKVQSDEGSLIHQFRIQCTFIDVNDSTKLLLPDSTYWNVYSNNSPVSFILTYTELKPNRVVLKGNFLGKENLTIHYLNQSVPVKIDSAVLPVKWDFGKGKAFELNLRRLADQSSFFAFDFETLARIAEYNISNVSKNFWVRSLSVDLNAGGTLGSDDKIRNGTQTSVNLSANPYYFVGRLIYQSRFSFGYQLETMMNSNKNKLLDVISSQFRIGLLVEIPFTNYPIFLLHRKTGYARLAMPLTIEFTYLPKGKNTESRDSFSRYDLKAIYELAFSPYLIVQGEYQYSKFINRPVRFTDDASFYSLSFAQDLNVVKKSIPFLGFIFGKDETEGKNFIFYRITSGRRAPAFQNLNEQSFGFGTYF